VLLFKWTDGSTTIEKNMADNDSNFQQSNHQFFISESKKTTTRNIHERLLKVSVDASTAQRWGRWVKETEI
jgi:hypothetical protein